MTKGSVVVSVTGTFLRGDGGTPEDRETVEVVCPGEYYQRNGSTFVLYEQLEEGFEEGTRCMLKIHEGQVTLRKRGLIVTEFEFEPGVCHMTQYTTPYGSFVLGITTTKLDISETEDELVIHAAYELEENYAGTSVCEIVIDIKPAGGAPEDGDAKASV